VIDSGVSNWDDEITHEFTSSSIRSIVQIVKSNEARLQLINFANRFDNQPKKKYFYVSDYQSSSS
jgi:hypothetical protein